MAGTRSSAHIAVPPRVLVSPVATIPILAARLGCVRDLLADGPEMYIRVCEEGRRTDGDERAGQLFFATMAERW
ncbi:hypothetical protein BU23DRAFT_559899 [Bimuria novae-zelandiae CBS 107.79]|uniref:Uncharacterized protein n=1 Tax=Bimuria novae-zelandiae CBS 107.79 TaxID=1447943 RepID=A0A6A5USD0_9PLEO|nr:hypothetical protein BU23DRAFT_559899 [Bimuria novae-zelandiae CBS 107.79]